MQRLNNISTVLHKDNVNATSEDDVVICAAVRTPLCKGKKGGLKDTAPEVLLGTVLKEAAERAKIPPKHIDDICVGNNLQPGAGEITARMGMFLGGYPDLSLIHI